MEQHNATAEGASDSAPDLWRNEVQARVAGYRTRRGRRIEGAFSMRFPFPPAEEAVAESEAEIAQPAPNEHIAEPMFSSRDAALASPFAEEPTEALADAAESVSAAPEASDTPTEEFFTPRRVPVPRPKRKVIAFPRSATVEPNLSIEEPLIPEQPRILEVAEEMPNLPATPLLDGLHFPSQQQPSEASRDHVELPLQAVSVGHRVYAGLVDCGVVVLAAGVFFAAGYKLMPTIMLTKPLVMILAAVSLLLWASYQYLFLMYGGKTAGMHLAGLRLSSFKGATPRWRQRRRRVMALYFSAASLMMGLLWALVDVDTLCWHDRISQTYVTGEISS